MDQKTHEIRLAQWEPIIKECKASGLSVAAWCRENNISAKKFYYWQRRLRAALTGGTTPDAPNFQPPSVAKKNTIVEFPTPVITPVTTIAPMGLHLNDYTVEINNDATPELITTIMKVMSYAQ